MVEGPPRALQEAVAEQLCDELLKCDQRIAAVQVYIRKPHVALPGVMDSVGMCCKSGKRLSFSFTQILKVA